MNPIGIAFWNFLSGDALEIERFEHDEMRSMDRFSKMSLAIACSLEKKIHNSGFDNNKLLVVLSTSTGPIDYITEYTHLINEMGPRAVNPSTFPNTMLSTALSRVTKELKISGPSVPMFLNESKFYQAVQYGATQLCLGKVEGCYILFVHENKYCFGLFLVTEEIAAGKKINVNLYFEERNGEHNQTEYRLHCRHDT